MVLGELMLIVIVIAVAVRGQRRMKKRKTSVQSIPSVVLTKTNIVIMAIGSIAASITMMNNNQKSYEII